MSTDLNRARDYLESGQLARCKALLESAIRSAPKNAHALSLRARLAAAQSCPAEAITWLRRAVLAAPNRWDVQLEAGALYAQLDHLEEAARRIETAIRLNPREITAHIALGRLHLDRLKQPSDAAKYFEAALAIQPGDVEAQYHYGKACFELGDIDRAVESFRAALHTAEKMDLADAALMCKRSMALAIPGSPAADNAEILRVRRDLAPIIEKAPAQGKFHGRNRDPDRPLIIGYVSSFFDSENWMKPVWGLLNEHDRRWFQVRIFSFGPVPGGEKLGAGVDTAWRPQESDHIFDVAGLKNEALAKVIMDEGVDLLVDLNGYSDMKRLGLFALRPAPVIVGWFNMYATTGLSCFDYLIGDRHVVAPSEEIHYSERIVRVGGSYLTFRVGYQVPPVSEPPCLSAGYVTFGSLCSRYKITPQVIRAWSEILLRCPGTRLLLRNGGLEKPGEREHLLSQFAGFGVEPERLELLGRAAHYQFLETYARIDVALDTFPYNGGTTTTEAIWQGVPVVAFAGRTWAGRTSATILREAQLADWVADDVEEYIALAVRWAGEQNSLTNLRRNMREKVAGSPVCDTPAFARSMESLYRDMWHDWARRAAN